MTGLFRGSAKEDTMKRQTSTLRIRRSALARAVLLVGLLISTPIAQAIEFEVTTSNEEETRPVARAVEVELTTANDFLTTNELDDDLYTFAFEMALNLGRYYLTLSENAFTDKTNEVRFDETYLAVGRTLPYLGRWRSYGEVGLLHVGEGIFGEDAQNAVHSLLGNKEVELPYVESRDVHPTVALHLERDLRDVGPFSSVAEVDVFSAIGFKSHASAAVRTSWQLARPVRLEAHAGARYSNTDFDVLKPWIASVGAVWGVGFDLFDRLALTWNYNEYGTKMQHFRIGYRLKTAGMKKIGTNVAK